MAVCLILVVVYHHKNGVHLFIAGADEYSLLLARAQSACCARLRLLGAGARGARPLDGSSTLGFVFLFRLHFLP
eukprot:COSAG01_NODE_8794_length_2656_cov_63.488463_2_plen_74_part_00